jgi:catechol 2,3-dioxygenase-like lactoylglutathione lyase family enzyme
MSEPIIKIRDIAYPRLRVPDLDRMERYLVDFGMTRAARTPEALYMTGADPGGHPLHVTERGEPAGLVGFALLANDARDLDRLAACEGASAVHDVDEPGGGQRVTLTDPHGFVVEVVHRMDTATADVAASLPLNLGKRVERQRVVKRIPHRASCIRRFGHLGINTPDVNGAFDWYHRRFGFLKSDVVGIGGMALAQFCRCDRGLAPTDHHTLLFALAPSGRPSLNHASWEVCDLDDIWTGHERLAAQSHRHHWGIGRHTLGSQIFDYWRDPWGLVHEHFTDGDLLDASHEPGVHEPDAAGSQWGPQMPPDFGQPDKQASAG